MWCPMTARKTFGTDDLFCEDTDAHLRPALSSRASSLDAGKSMKKSVALAGIEAGNYRFSVSQAASGRLFSVRAARSIAYFDLCRRSVTSARHRKSHPHQAKQGGFCFLSDRFVAIGNCFDLSPDSGKAFSASFASNLTW